MKKLEVKIESIGRDKDPEDSITLWDLVIVIGFTSFVVWSIIAAYKILIGICGL